MDCTSGHGGESADGAWTSCCSAASAVTYAAAVYYSREAWLIVVGYMFFRDVCMELKACVFGMSRIISTNALRKVVSVSNIFRAVPITMTHDSAEAANY